MEQKRIPLNDNIIWWKYSKSIKNLSKSEKFFLSNAPKYLGARLFLFSLRANFTYFLKGILLKKK